MKLRFNKKNFFKLQLRLYGMDDNVLKNESEMIQHNFESWLAHHFELSARQLNYLETIDHQLKLTLSSDTSFAIENRLPISLNRIIDTKQFDNKKLMTAPNETMLHQHIASYSTCGTLQININCD